jgi:hypothetical protein
MKFSNKQTQRQENLTQEDFRREVERILRRVERLKAALAGNATVERVWRKGYTERKRRTVRGHYMCLVKLSKSTRPQLKVLRGGR